MNPNPSNDNPHGVTITVDQAYSICLAAEALAVLLPDQPKRAYGVVALDLARIASELALSIPFATFAHERTVELIALKTITSPESEG